MISEAFPGLIAAAMLIALGGAAHCAGMCGGISAALSFAVPESRRQGKRLWGWQLLFGAGRLTTYGLLGAAAGALGGRLLAVLPAPGMALGLALAGTLMAFLAVHLAGKGGLLMGLELAGKQIWNRIQPVTRLLMPIDRIHKAWLLGVVWGLLPCGLVYTALALAATSGTALTGLCIMLAFGAVTVMPVAASGVVASRLALLRSPVARRLALFLTLSLSVAFFLLAWQMRDAVHHHASPAPHGEIHGETAPEHHSHRH
ncbi:MAG: hypothetical protein CL537_07650 [Alcanivoracaceae bacterium]|uniref:sulfite exporter TauE/SafE family protein n=1 Tax=Alcanivorax sp. MD8A TaxID=1177157 RepID=UPI000C46D233|nr:sulfite exporter TauE/SafE family protein [Alcanivorax sp. MD8A]MAX55370.1 hypothetical protein [Alcanivoracaceae bacterium]MCG8440024.1 sulfite exporter TauE/SafE family protein [Pseudomonadales bacterium]PNE02104.1 hypothetical protein A15D_02316 [Alcanivorax sp. MD8A]